MIFSTSNQINCFLIFMFLGIVFSIIFNIINILFFKKFAKKFKKNLINCVFFAFFSIVFIIFLNLFNFGEFSLALCLATFLGFIWLNFISKNLVVFLSNLWYNKKQKRKKIYARKKN